MDGAFFLGFLLILFLIFAAIGKYHPVSGAEVLDWKPTRSPEVEAELELDDVDQMLEAQNERRRRRGLPDRTEDDVRAINRRLQDELAPGLFDLILYCPHHPYGRLWAYAHDAPCLRHRLSRPRRRRLSVSGSARGTVG